MLATISFISLSITSVYSWGYDKPGNNVSHWSELVAECGYSRQSPIDLPSYPQYNKCKQPLELQWTSEHSHYAIRNNGHSLVAVPFLIDHNGGSDISGLQVLHHKNDTNIRIENSFYTTYESMVNKEYCFNSLHFHWGKTDDAGSEHTVNGEAFPLEVHLVHYSCDYIYAGDALKDYSTGQAAINSDDANVLAVIGVFFEIGAPNPVLSKILDDVIMDAVAEGKDKHPVDSLLEMYYTEFDVKGLLPESREMVAYLGSLTTPPCYETVRWHVMKDTMTVSEEQMEKFRMFLQYQHYNDSMAPNFRPVMPLNDRKIYQCAEDVDDDALFESNELKDGIVGGTNGDGMSEEALKWKMIAIGFISVFSVTFLLCMIISCIVYKNWDMICDKKDHGPPNRPKRTASDSNAIATHISHGVPSHESNLYTK